MNICVAFFLILSTQITVSLQREPSLLVLSIDAFGQSLFDSIDFAPTLQKIRANGVYTVKMNAEFPTITYPNHHSMATGRYVENHGVVANDYYDPDLNETFHSDSATANDKKWWGQAEPVWVTAEKAGIRTGVSGWPGGTVVYDGGNANKMTKYTSKDDFSARIDEAMGWFSSDSVRLVFMKYDPIDENAHEFGVSSEQVKDQVKIIDWYLAYLVARISDYGLSGCINLLLCADHGSADVTSVIYLDKYVPTLQSMVLTIPSYGAYAHIWPLTTADQQDSIFQILNNNLTFRSVAEIYNNTVGIPEELHYTNSSRIPPLLAVATSANYFIWPYESSPVTEKSGHGWPVTTDSSMRPIFIASGPKFKTGNITDSVDISTRDIYLIVCHFFNIEGQCQPHDANEKVPGFVLNSAPSMISAVFLFFACTSYTLLW